MDHTKKMFLVDSYFDLRKESRHHSALDRAISSVLNADLPERENNYNTTKRYNVIKQIHQTSNRQRTNQ